MMINGHKEINKISKNHEIFIQIELQFLTIYQADSFASLHISGCFSVLCVFTYPCFSDLSNAVGLVTSILRVSTLVGNAKYVHR